MYDAKNEKIINYENKVLKYKCISDKMYFEMSYKEHLKRNKASFVPLENLFE